MTARFDMSVVVFSAAAGLGYGLLALMGTFRASGLLPADRWFGFIGLGLAFVAIAIALAAALHHLGRPATLSEAFAGWRESWLPRTALLAAATGGFALLFACGWIVLDNTAGAWRWFGLIAASFSAMTVYCAAMIHGSLTDIFAWSNKWAAPCHMALALLGGALWLGALTQAFGIQSPDIAMLVVVALFLAFYLKRKYWQLIDRAGAGALDSAVVVRLRRRAFLGLFAVPLLLSMVGLGQTPWVALPCAFAAALSASYGLLAERWLYFAEPDRDVALYYGP